MKRGVLRQASGLRYVGKMRMCVGVLRVFGLATWSAVVITLAALPGCDRNLEPFDAEEEVRPPDLDRIFPAEAQPGPGLRADRPSADSRGTLPPETRRAPGVSGAEPVRGRIELAPALAGQVPEGAILFIIARRGAERGPPLAVNRIPAPRFPLEFTIGPENVMIPGMKFEGEIQLSARVDGDGNAMTRKPGDLQGALAEPVLPGSQVSIVLDERL